MKSLDEILSVLLADCNKLVRRAAWECDVDGRLQVRNVRQLVRAAVKRLQSERGADSKGMVIKSLPMTEKQIAHIQAYADIFGHSWEQAAQYMLSNQILEHLKSGMLMKAHEEMEAARVRRSH